MRYAVITLPRSRSAWLAEWLGAEHEALSRIGSLDELTAEGIVDTGSALFFDGLWHRWPNARYLFVFRDIRDIARSCERAGLPTVGLDSLRTRQETAYASVAGAENVRVVHFHQLDDMDVLASIWSFLKGTKFDESRTRRLIGVNIQCSIPAVLEGMDPARMRCLLAQGGV